MHPSLTLERLAEAGLQRMIGVAKPGFCTTCGAEADGVEPNASGLECESCGEDSVCSAAEILKGMPHENAAHTTRGSVT